TNAYNTAFKISKMIQKHLNIPIDDSEIVYLALHIYHFENQISSSHN
ncbi:transcriptional regulator, partial [Staphylococcus haemolyticus]